MKILDIFVGNEKVVAKVFDLIFPSKPSGLPQASRINIDSGGRGGGGVGGGGGGHKIWNF